MLILGGLMYSTEFLFLRPIFPLPLLFLLQHTQLMMTVLMMTVATTAMIMRMIEVSFTSPSCSKPPKALVDRELIWLRLSTRRRNWVRFLNVSSSTRSACCHTATAPAGPWAQTLLVPDSPTGFHTGRSGKGGAGLRRSLGEELWACCGRGTASGVSRS